MMNQATQQAQWIWQDDAYLYFSYDRDALEPPHAKITLEQGKLITYLSVMDEDKIK